MSSRFREFLNRLFDRLRRDHLSADLDDELRFHQAMLERDHRARGADAQDARRGGRLQLGNPTSIKEETRDMWSLGWVDDALQDVRYAARVLRRNLGFTVAVVLTLALGIGANTALFTVVNAVVLRPLPYADPDRLYSIWTVPVGSPNDRNPASYPDLTDWQAQNTAFSSIGGYVFNRFEMSGPEGIDQARAIISTKTVYPTLGAQPLIGRLPRPDEEHLPVVTISHRLWQSRYAGDRSVIGRRVSMNDQPFTIIGVMPPGFHFPTPDIDLWMSLYPLSGAPDAPATSPWITSRGMHGYRVIGRLRPGVTPAAAEAQMNAIMARLATAYPETNAGTDIRLQSIRDDSVRDVQRALWLMLGAAGLVLLLACANVAHLMLARTSTRAREIAVRRALGAHRGRVMRQLLTESVLLGVLGGIAGIAVASAAMRIFIMLSPADIPRLENVSLDVASLVFAASASIATGILFGLAPTIVAWSNGAQATLREQGRGAGGGRQAGRARAMLTAAEVAFALVLLVGSGLMIRSFAALLTTDMGFHPDPVVTFHLTFSSQRYPKPTDKVAMLDRVFHEVRSIPGVTAVGASTSMPPIRMQQGSGIVVEGEPRPKAGQELQVIYIPATPEFLPALGVPLLSGRQFNDGDNATAAPVAIISRDLARRAFAGRDPIGHRVELGDAPHTIIGVVGDVPYQGVGQEIRPQLYVPFAQSPFGGVWVAVKTSVDTRTLIAPIQEAIRRVDPMTNAREVRPMVEMISDTMVRPRFQTWLLTTFGGLALILAAVGIYGVIAYGVAQRTSEIGLRLALGAPTSSVVRLVLARGLIPVAFGLVVGIAGAIALSRVMIGLLHDVSPTDPVTFVAMTAVLTLVAVGAAYAPASRAARLDPVRALRTD